MSGTKLSGGRKVGSEIAGDRGYIKSYSVGKRVGARRVERKALAGIVSQRGGTIFFRSRESTQLQKYDFPGNIGGNLSEIESLSVEHVEKKDVRDQF